MTLEDSVNRRRTTLARIPLVLRRERAALRALWRIGTLLRADLPTVGGALLALLAGSGAQLLIPRLLQRAVDEGIARGDLPRVGTLGAAMLSLALLRATFSIAEALWATQVAERTARDLRLRLHAHLQHLAFSFHDQAQTGQLLTRLLQDVDAVRTFLSSSLLELLAALLLLVGSLAFIAATQPALALLTLALAPVAAVAYAVFFVFARPFYARGQQLLADVGTVLQENLAAVRVVRALAAQDEQRRRFEKRSAAYRDLNLRLGRLSAFLLPLLALIANLGTLALLWLGGQRIMTGQMTVGELLAFTNYLLLALGPLFMVSTLILAIARAAAGAQRIFEVLDTPLAVQDAPDAVPLPPLRGEVRFEQVWFRYFPHQPWVLQDVSFSVAAGQKIAVVGPSGAGKSSLVNLIPRFYEASAGRVLLDGYDVRHVTLASLRRQIGVVMQDPQLISGRIRELIAFGKPEASLEEIIAAAQAAQAHDFIMALPEGYDTPVGERGVTLSGGQRQRLALARAVLINPRVLILDDATSQVDAQTEARIRQTLAQLMTGRTVFIIAQRAATLRMADWVLVLQNGRLIVQGRHEDLLESCALYARLYAEMQG